MSLDALQQMIESVTWVSQICQRHVAWQQTWGLNQITSMATTMHQQFPQMALANSKLSNLNAIGGVFADNFPHMTHHRRWRQRYYEELTTMLREAIGGDGLTLRQIFTLQNFVTMTAAATPNPPWEIQRLLNWGHELVTGLVELFHRVVRLGVDQVLTTRLVRNFLRRQERKLLKVFGLYLQSPPPSWPPTPTVRPTYGRLTCVQTCAPPLA